MTNPALRARYMSTSVTTASPGQLLVMLYDRLVVDLTRAEEALQAGDRAAGSERLLHAQDIVAELRATLNVDAWEGGPGLAQLYDFLLKELIRANVRADATVAASSRALVEPLRDAWRQALVTVQADAATVAGPVQVG
jgi:flagellar secretion chaperone FliS